MVARHGTSCVWGCAGVVRRRLSGRWRRARCEIFFSLSREEVYDQANEAGRIDKGVEKAHYVMYMLAVQIL